MEPVDLFSQTRFELEYERPWGDLPVEWGRAAVMLPGPVGLRPGGAVERTRTPTVELLSVSALLGWGQVLRTEFWREDLRVAGLALARRMGGRLDLRLRAGSLDCGLRAELLHDPARTVQRRQVWLTVRGAAGAATLARRTGAWSPGGAWSARLDLPLTSRLRVGLGWEGSETALAVEFRPPGFAVTTRTIWSGPRSGGFGLRLAEDR